MDGILYDLFRGEYKINMEQGKEQQELCKKLIAEWDKVQEALGEKFVDRLTEMEGELEEWQAFQYYRAGVQMGVRLMLEALGL